MTLVLHNYLLKFVLCKYQGYQLARCDSNQYDDNGRTGAISDGLHWAIWHNYNREWYIADFTTHSMEDSFTLLSQSRFHFSPLLTFRDFGLPSGGETTNVK